MGTLRINGREAGIPLGIRNLIGRGQLCQIIVSESHVSSEHAIIFYHDGRWKLRDLGSKNGTRVGSAEVVAGSSVELPLGVEIQLGNGETTCSLIHDGAPGPYARRLSGDWASPEGQSLWLPSPEVPLGCVTWNGIQWILETEVKKKVVGDGEHVDLGGEEFWLELPQGPGVEDGRVHGTTLGVHREEGVTFEFTVGANEEHVSLRVHTEGAREVDLGARAHNYALLLLARERLSDETKGRAPGESGWIYADELATMLNVEREVLNVQLFRARQAFRRAGLSGDHVFERRSDTHQVRILSSRLLINELGSE